MTTRIYGPRRPTTRMVRAGNNKEEGRVEAADDKDGKGKQCQ